MALGIGPFINALSSPGGQMTASWLTNRRFRKENERVRQENLARYNKILANYTNMQGYAMRTQREGANREYGFLRGANEAILGDQDRIIGGYQTRYDRFMPGMRADQDRLQGAYGDANRAVMDTLNATAGDVTSGYADLDRLYQGQLDTARSKVAGISDQDRQDAIEAYDKALASSNARLASRGYGGSTIQTAEEGTNTRQRGAELRRVNDARLMRELGVEADFGGRLAAARERGIGARSQMGLTRADAQRMLSDRTLSAEERQNAARYLYDTALSGDVLAQREKRLGYRSQGLTNQLNQMTQADQDALNIYLQTEGNRLGFMERREDPYPQNYPELYQQAGYNAGPLPRQPRWYDNLAGPLIGAGGQIAGAGIYANALQGMAGGGYMPQYPGGWGPPSY